MVAVPVVEGDAQQEGLGAGAGEILGRGQAVAALVLAGLDADADLAEAGILDVGAVAGAAEQPVMEGVDRRLG